MPRHIQAHRLPAEIEWPTLAIAAAIYLAFAGVVVYADAMHPLVLALAGGAVVAWQGSLQHEVVHGHPTPWRLVNRLLVLPCPWLWLPFESYRRSHLAHHRDALLTVPGVDPESFFVSEARYASLPRIAQLWLNLERYFLGALVLRSLRAPFAYWHAWLTGRERLRRRELALHAVGCALPLGFAMGVGGLSVFEYVVFFALPGIALTGVRSFAEHRYVDTPHLRTNVTLTRGPFAWLFLNNNLHAAHHREPCVAWYRLPRRYRDLSHSGELDVGFTYSGYAEVFVRYALQPRSPAVYPGALPATSTPPRRS